MAIYATSEDGKRQALQCPPILDYNHVMVGGSVYEVMDRVMDLRGWLHILVRDRQLKVLDIDIQQNEWVCKVLRPAKKEVADDGSKVTDAQPVRGCQHPAGQNPVHPKAGTGSANP